MTFRRAAQGLLALLRKRRLDREREMAVRAAPGAGRRLVAQLPTESLALCIPGGVAGVATAYLPIQAAPPVLSELLPFTAQVHLDLRVLCSAGATDLPAGAYPAPEKAALFHQTVPERLAWPGLPDPAVVYVPLAQAPEAHIKLVLRSRLDPAAVLPGIREAVRAIDPNLPLSDIATLEQLRDRTLSGSSRPAWASGSGQKRRLRRR